MPRLFLFLHGARPDLHDPLELAAGELKSALPPLLFLLQVVKPVDDGVVFLSVAVPGLLQLKPAQLLLPRTLLIGRQSGVLDALFVSVLDLCHFGLQLFPEVALWLGIVGADHNFILKGEGL